MRFPGQQGQIFGGPQHPPNHPSNHSMPGIHPQAHSTPPVMHARAKWHIPQSVQQNNGKNNIDFFLCCGYLRQFHSIQKWPVHRIRTL